MGALSVAAAVSSETVAGRVLEGERSPSNRRIRPLSSVLAPFLLVPKPTSVLVDPGLSSRSRASVDSGLIRSSYTGTSRSPPCPGVLASMHGDIGQVGRAKRLTFIVLVLETSSCSADLDGHIATSASCSKDAAITD
ncbi:hypothetical protein MVEN_02209500 [Mycena venus]|uniref:Uncharacterized protein n=1 Tax=Mycena venus TaxID=2733690 RepID=A0A8H6X7N6_9AGAR|nr:hypothetical protein MVEN_02209500 [Mycena venus]